MLFERFSQTVIRNSMINTGDRIIVALSGGSDSVAMLLLLIEYKKNCDYYLEAFHFNHMIRGEDAADDEKFCEELCSKLDVPFHSAAQSVPEYAEKSGKSLEEAARDLRYAALRKRAAEVGEGTKIAVAHNKNDNIETVFFNISRGTSVEGLRGIRPVYKDVIRPLLDITKDETYEICEKYGIKYRVDKTNFETIAVRNKIRLELLPKINETLGIDFGKKLLSLSGFAENDCDFMEKEAEKAYANSVSGGFLDCEKLRTLHPAISSRVVRRFISEAASGGVKPFADNVSITKTMVSRVIEYAESGTNGGYIELGKGVFVKKHDNKLKTTDFKEDSNGIPYNLSIRELSKNELAEIIAKVKKSTDNTVLFDKKELYEITSGREPLLRHPESGDLFATIGGAGKKQLRRFLTDIKVPADERKNVFVLADGHNILHIFGIRRSKYATIHKGTECAIMYELRR